ncbi:non-ribosomal peptide synthase/polyketide synthase, partial [Rhodococcus sp. NPDC003318]|uniref:non-ribosomal peptide synthase/polyketide synthase n=1 Tax=Rhodococcus sp. NPDC003318 TaxID=3364503 RepID=UPI00368EA4AD
MSAAELIRSISALASVRADAVVASPDGMTVTYGELEERLQLLGGALAERGMDDEAIVSVVLTGLAPTIVAADGGVGAVLDKIRSEAVEAGVAGATSLDQDGWPLESAVETWQEWVEHDPDAVAVVADGVVTTRGQLDRRANRLARELARSGAGPDDVVALVLPRSRDWVVGMLAAWKLGAAYSPLDPTWSFERISGLLDASGARAVVAADGWAHSGHVSVPVTILDDPDTADRLAGHDDAPLDDPWTGADAGTRLAYVISTSGSTGTPKPTLVSMRGVSNTFQWYRAEIKLGAEAGVLVASSPLFDLTQKNVWAALTSGAALHLAQDRFDPREILGKIASGDVQFVNMAPSAFEVLVDLDTDGVIGNLEVVTLGGEQLRPSAYGPLVGGTTRVLNSYGPTEASDVTTAYELDLSAADAETVPVPIGRALRGVEHHVLDRRLRPVPPGISGELYIGGFAVGRGYGGMAALTSSRFVASPFGEPGSRLYRTGDVVRERSDGALIFMGRSDFQVKIRGMRIELGEIEAALVAHPEVMQSVVVVRERDGVSRLVGYVTAAAGGAPAPEALREALARDLPAHMVPDAVLVLDALPLNHSGKIDRKALPDPDFGSAADFRPPATAVERVVAEIFGEILGVDRVGADDSFFDLGGNSLSAARVVARLNAAVGCDLSLREVFDAPTVSGVAALAEAGASGTARPRPALVAGARPERIPLSLAQSRMWFINQFDTSSAAYNLPLGIRLSGDLNVAALASAVANVLDRHESLRTVFPDDGDGPRQLVLAPSEIVFDLDPIRVDGEADLTTRLAALASQGFDVTTEIPVRPRLFEVGPREHVLLFLVHHIAADGESMAPLARDVMTAYEAYARGGTPETEPLAVQYADFSIWQRELLGSDDDPDSVLARQVGYWRTALAGIPDLLELPLDRPRPAVQSMRGGRVDFEIDARLHDRISRLTREHEATLFTTVHAAFAVLLAKLSGSDDIVVGTPTAGRGEAALDDLVGMFVNTLALRTIVDPSASFAELLTATRESDVDALANSDVPFERLVEVLAPQRSTAHAPVFQVALTLENTAPVVLEMAGLSVAEVDPGVTFAKFDLQLSLAERADGGMSGRVVYAADLFDEPSVRTLAERFVRVLGAVTDDPSRPVGDLDVTDAAERRALIPVTARPAAGPATLARLLTSGIADRDAEAAVFGDRVLTYGELDDRSNALARVLISHGAGPETFVALSLPRSLEAIVAVWAVAKSGAAFVPMDPAYPADRIEHMATDSGATIGLTTADAAASLPAGVRWLALDEPGFGGDRDARSTAPITAADRIRELRVHNSAYVIYTSGSTGLPKGVVVTHTGLSSVVAEHRDRFGLDASSRVLHFASPSFDGAVWEQLMTFVHGATAIVVPQGVYGGEELHEILAAQRVTHGYAGPAALNTVDPGGLPALQSISVAGEAASRALVDRWAPRHPFRNLYGPTETTMIATATSPMTAGQTVTIGRPMPGVAAVVLDRRLRPVPVGVTGELYVAGPSLARGYHDRPDLTAARFVAAPFGTADVPVGARMYRTGDLVRWVPAATPGTETELELEYVGRSDFQVKVRGFRIELGEIDGVLTTHERVDTALTVGTRGPSGATVLVSYVVPVAGAVASPRELTDHVAAVLPTHMVPSVVVLDSLPLTLNGKVDRKALPEPDFGALKDAYVAPTTPIEETLAGLYAEVLGLDRVGVTESFFALGGDSIVSIQLVARAKAAGIVIRARDVFERKTVSALAQVATIATDADVAALAERPGGGVGEMPLLPVARWALGNGAGSRFSQAVLLTAPKNLSRPALAATLQTVLDRHPALRAALVAQRLLLDARERGSADAADLIVRVELDAQTRPGTTAFEEIAARALDDAADRLDPAAGVMVQVVWFDPAPASTTNGRLLLVLHHLAVDGVSWRVLVPELAAAWQAHTAGTPPAPRPEGTSVRAWSHALVAEASTAERVAELDHWQQVLAEEEAPLGARLLDPEHDTVATRGQVSAELPADLTDTLLTAVPATYRAGAQDGLLTALALATAQWRRRRGENAAGTLVTLEGHGREEEAAAGAVADLSRTVGWFTSVYPVRLDVTGIDLDDAFAGGPAAGAAIKAVKEQLLAVPGNGIGYGLLRHLNPETGAQLAAAAVPQIGFNYLGRFGGGEITDEIRELGWIPVTDGGELGGAADPGMALGAALEINASVAADGGLSATLSYARGVLTDSEASEFAALWTAALTAVSTHTRRGDAGGFTPSDLPLVPLTQTRIEQFEAQYPGLEDLWSLSPLQHGLLFHALLTEGIEGVVDVYTAQFVLDLTGALNPDRVRRAADRLLERHPNLRAAFVVDEDLGAVQVITSPSSVPLREFDLSDLGTEDRATERGRILGADRVAGFDTAAAPLIRLTLLELGADHWQLVFTNHHVILDGWSTPLVVRELMTLYALDGDDSALPRPRGYRDYLGWLSRQDRQQSLDVWRGALSHVDEPTLLAPAAQGVNHAAVPGKVEHALTADETARADALARELGVTVNTLVQTAWALVLGMLTGRDDVVFGATVSGRPAALSGVESMAGLFINTIPVAVAVDPHESVRALITRVQSEQADLLDHHFVGLTDIHKAAGDGAVFDTAVIYESYPVDTSGAGGDVDIAGVRLTGVESAAASHFPLSIVAAPAEGRLHFAAEFQREAFDEATVAAHLTRMVAVLHAFVERPDARVSSLQLVTDAEWSLLASYNRTELARTGQTLLERIDARTAEAPNAPAVVADGVTVSRGDLDQRANRLAHELLAHGIGADDVVALVVPRSVDWVVGMLAAWKAGAAYLPVDPKAPADRIAAILEDCDVAAVVATNSWTDEVGYTGPLVVLGDSAAERRLATRPESTPPNRWREPGAGLRLAYVITTSGSTGRPKPTLVPMAGTLNTAEWYRGEIRLEPGDGALVANSPVFDQTQKNVWVTLSDGAVLHLAADPFDPVDVLEIVRRGAVVNANMAPSAFGTLLDADTEQTVLPALRSLHLGGESFNPARLAHLEAAGTRLHNNYGPTEATDMVTDHWLRDVTTAYPDGRVPIGPALPNYELYVLDSQLRLVPPGVPGELYIGGASVLARGYGNRIALTATRFVANPFRGGERMYQSGDVVWWNADGELEYVGRTDFQVKIRGLRVELGEIEAVLSADPRIAQAAVVVTTSASGIDRLVAYVVPAGDPDGLEAVAAAAAAGSLPDYMVPSAMVVLDEIPLTPSGKLDRKVLPEPDFGSSDAEYTAPAGATEELVATVFGELLGVDRVSATDSFFALGGDSLVATRTVARVNAGTGASLRLRDLFEAPTVTELAARIDAAEASAGRLALVARPRPERIPLSLAQQRMWFLNQYDTGSPVYNIPMAIRLTGALDEDAMRSALGDVLARHESLRTVFPADADGARQVVLAPSDVDLDVSTATVPESDVAADLVEFFSRGFDVTTGVPLRIRLIRVGDTAPTGVSDTAPTGVSGTAPAGVSGTAPAGVSDTVRVLALSIHHISSDGASTAPLARDLITAYVARTGGQAPQWAPLEVQYADFSIWQREVLGTPDDPQSVAAAQIDYWRSALAGLPEVLDLPADRPRPAEQSFRAGTVRFALDEALRRRLESLARKQGATLFMAVHSALAILLSRLGGTEDVAIATPVAGRGERQLDDLVGMFVNTLVLRTDIDSDASFTELLAAVRETDLGAFGHADVPFEQLVEALNPTRSRAHAPFAQVILGFQNLEQASLDLPGLTVSPLQSGFEVAKFDLQLMLSESDSAGGGALAAELTYAVDLFDESTASDLVARFVRVLESVVSAPQRPVGALGLLDAAETARLTPVSGPPAIAPATMPELLAAAVAANPGAAAIEFGDTSLTYRELDERSNRLARSLIGLGVGPEDFVAVALGRSVESVLAVWAITKTGAAFVPLDLSYPPERIEYLVADSGVRVGLTVGADVAALPAAVTWLELDSADFAESVGAETADPIGDTDRLRPLALGSGAYMVYTSGSTGKPKGVLVTHEGLANLAAHEREHFSVTARSRTLHFASPSFDGAVLELLLAIGSAATMVIVPPGIYGGAELGDFLREHRVTHAFVTTAALATVDPAGLELLTDVAVGGEAVSAELVAKWAPGRRLYDIYGPTETTAVVTMSDPMAAGERITIGGPVRGVDALVLDHRLRPVPVGVPGELYFAGPALGRGYHGRFALTADRFVANPFGDNGSRMYRTGDVVRWVDTPAGLSIEYVGRSDFQLKVRGFRIELGEIDAVLGRHESVEFAATVGHRTESGNTVLVAYVLAAEGHTIDRAALAEYAGVEMPSHMVPTVFTEIESIPLTPNGKLDRTVLPEPVFDSTGEYRAPRTPVEEVVAGVFADVLGVDRVSVDEDFFDIGGNSLAATRVVARVGATLGARVGVRELFDAPTVAGFAARVTALAGGAARPVLTAQDRPARVPLSLAQKRIWFLNQFDTASAAYNIPLGVRLTGDLDVVALEAAMRDVLVRHESLRTIYPSDADGPHQVVLPADHVSVELTRVTVDEAGLMAQAADFARRGFDVTESIPLRAALFEVDTAAGSESEHVLLVVVHHISADGSSMTPLARDVMLAYVARTQGEAPGWEPLAVQYADFALWQREALGSEDDPDSVIATQIAHWKGALAGLPDLLELPTDRPRPAVQSTAGDRVTFPVPADLAAAVEALARRSGATSFMVMQAACAVLLSHLSGTGDIAVGTAVAGRGEEALDPIVGMFVGTLVLRTRVDSGASFEAVLESVREGDLQAFSHADLPFERLVEILDPPRSTAHAPLVQVSFGFENIDFPTFELPGLRVTGLDADLGQAKYDLELSFAEGDSGLVGTFGFATALFDRATIERTARRYVRILEAVVADPGAVVGDLDLLDETERDRMLVEFNRTQVPVEPTTLVELLDRSVARNPDAPAMTFEDVTLTYAQFDARVNHLARHLISLGVGPEDRVVLAARRSMEMLVGMYAVMKAGGAYVPVDPDQPADRIERVLSLSRPVCVLTTSWDDAALPASVPVIEIDRVELGGFSDAPITDADRTRPLRRANPAYVIFTSGSTGVPKGVSVAHHAIVNQLSWFVGEYEMTADDVVIQKTPTVFDPSVWELFVPFVVGGHLVIATPDGHRDAEYLIDLSRRYGATVLGFVPSMLAAFLGGPELSFPPSVRALQLAGEALSPDLAARTMRASNVRINNAYGPAETTLTSVHYWADGSETTMPIGIPVWNSQAYVLDERLHPAAPGVRGELYLAGGQVARGYHDRPGLTAERFVANPFAADGAVMYRTGDVARWGTNGQLEYLGRTDFQVKLRGQRIELGEIEAALLDQPSVEQAVVVAADTERGKRLVGYVVGSGADTSSLVAALSATLPGYMVPDAIVVLERMPVTGNGKLDRNALPAPDFGSDEAAHVTPRTPTEETLAAVFAEVLGVDRVSVEESFFALGGDSIMSIQLVTRAKAAGLAFTARQVFEQRTVAGLAAVATAAADAPQVLAELPGGGVGELSATPIMVATAERGGLLRRFSQSSFVTLPPGIDRATVESTIAAVVERHDALRLRWHADGSGLTVPAAGDVTAAELIRRVEFGSRPGSDEFVALVREEFEAAADRLDPVAGVVAQFVWFDPAAGLDWNGRLLVVVHHLAVDGVSWRILLPDFATAWGALHSGSEPELAPVGTSLRRWTHGLVESASSEQRLGELDYWRGVIGRTDPVLGSRAIDPARDTVSTTGRVRVEASAETTEGLLTAVPGAFGGGVNDGLLAALALAVARWRERRGVVAPTTLLNLEGHGREEAALAGDASADLSRTVGWFTSLFPVRLDLTGIDLGDAFAGGPAAGRAVKAVKEQLLAVPDKGIGFGMLRYLNADTAEQLSGTTTPQIGFNYLGRAGTVEITDEMRAVGWVPATDGGDLGSALDPDMPVTALDINAVVTNVGGVETLSTGFDFATGVLSEAEVTELTDLWTEALDVIARYASTPGAGGRTPSDLPLVTLTQGQIENFEARCPDLSDIWSLSPLQYGMYFHAALAESSVDVYTAQLSLKLSGTVDADRMLRAAQALVDRHPGFRTAFVPGDSGVAVQIVQSHAEIPFVTVDLSALAPAQREAERRRILDADRLAKFDLTAPPLIRMTLIDLGDEQYELVVMNHHIVIDGWSTPLVLKELLVLYAADGDASVLPVARSYRDFLAWLAERDHERSLRVWTDSLAGVEGPTLLVSGDRGRQQGTTSGQYLTGLDADATAALVARARELGVTPNTVVQAAWAILLGALTGREDAVFGATVSGRPPEIAGVESMIGLFINTVPTRVRLVADESVSELLVRVQAEQALLLDHHYVGLAEIQRAAGEAAMFDTLAVFESFPVDMAGATSETDIAGMRVTGIDGVDAAHYPVAMTASLDSELHLKFIHATELVDEAAVRTLSERFVRVLTTLVADPATAVGDVAVTDEAERAALSPVRGPVLPEPARTLPELMAAAAADRDATALVFGDTAVSYGELDERSNALARVLIERGVGPESFVASALPRSIQAQVALWAIAKTGAAFVPMDPAYPADRIEHMVTDSGAVLGLTGSAHAAELPGSIGWLVLDDPEFVAHSSAMSVAPLSDTDRTAPIDVANAAYVIYTSGSTGLPKGVVVSHEGLANFAAEQRERYSVTARSRALHFSSPSFDASILELLLALGAGAALVIVPPGVYGGAELAEVISAGGATHAFITPGALATLSPEGLDCLAHLVAGGEAVPDNLVDIWAPGRHFHNGYGPTETIVMVAISEPLTPGERLTIGGPIRNIDAMVLDTRLRPVPVGVAGELYVSGAQLARGYHARPALTADRFVANPFEPGTRMYRTGDVVRWVQQSGGLEIEYVGRSDFQVKVRGFRIELGEIDAALSAHGSVDFAVTVGRTGPSGATVLAAYVVAVPGRSVDTDALAEFVGRTLPSHMVPSAIVVMDAIPLTVNGKVDRKALPEPDFGSSEASYVAPSNRLEEILAELFAEVLGVDRVGVADSFFALGGDSIVSIQLVARAKAAGVVIRARDVFERKTVAGLAQVAALGDESSAPVVLAELPGGGVGEAPLTPIMRWMTDRPGGHNRMLMPAYLALPDGIDHAGLVATLGAVVERHDMLRASIPAGGDVLRVAGSVEVGALVDRVEFGADELPGSAGFDALAAATYDAAAGLLDVATGSVVRFVWFDPAPGLDATGRLLIVAHHLVVDGVSWRIIVADLLAAWQAVAAGSRPELQPVGTSMRRWAQGLADQARTATRESELPYWRAVQDGPDPLLASRALDPAVDTFASTSEVRVELSEDVTEAVLTAVPGAVRGGVNDGLLAALALAVSAWRRDRHVDEASTLIKLEGHGREEEVLPGADLSRTVGWFTSMFPLRLDLAGIDLDSALSGGPAAGEAVKAVKEQLLAVPDKGVGYGLLRYLNPSTGPELAEHALPQIGFNYLGRIGADAGADAAPIGWLPAPAGELSVSAAPDVDMPAAAVVDINASVTGSILGATFTFPPGLIDGAEVRALATLWERALSAIATWATGVVAPVFTPSDLPLVSVSQKEIERLEAAYPSLEDVWSLTPLQEGMFFHASLAGSSESLDVYTSQVVVSLGGVVDVDRMHTAAQALVDRHPNLRAGFVHDEHGSPVQVIVEQAPVAFRSVDLAGHDDVEGRRREIRDEDRYGRFDLAAPPLVRVAVVRTATDRYDLVVTTHHILVDGWSMPLIFRDLIALYATRGDVSAFPPVRSFRGYLEWLSARDAASSLEVWANSLAGTEDPTLLAPQERGREQSAMPEVLTLDLDAERNARLEALARELGVTVNTVVQAAWGIVLSRLVGRDDVVFGATVSGRPAALTGVESMVGMFINTLPVRVRLDRGESLRALLSRVQLEQSDLLDHHFVGLPDIQQRAGAGAVFDTITVFESYPVDAASAGGDGDIDGMRLLGVDGVDANTFPLSLYIEQGEGLQVQAKFLPDVFSRNEISEIVERLDRALGRFVDAPDSTVAELEVLSVAELSRLDELNATDHVVPVATLPELFDVQVARTPDAVALVFEGQELTYAE